MVATLTRAILAALACLLVSGCDNIPTHNFDNRPLSITADGQDYVTCGPYSLSDDGGFGQTSYSITFKDASDGNEVMLKGVKKLTIMELPTIVDALMPTLLPDIKTEHPQGGGPYQEGATYTWTDGSQATIHNGEWQAVKQRNPVCRSK